MVSFSGTAMDALSSMQSFLRSRPDRFRSLEYAVEWSVRSGQVRNVESARVSMPGQLKSAETGECAAAKVGMEEKERAGEGEREEGPSPKKSMSAANSITEEEEGEEENTKSSSSQFSEPAPVLTKTTATTAGTTPAAPSASKSPQGGFKWRIDLASTERHWPGWFSGLSEKFLSVPASKLLLLAGVDRLDKALTVGQMQGKFQVCFINTRFTEHFLLII